MAGVAGPGFVTPELALGLILAAALVPGAKVEQSEKTIAGQSSKCATATGLEAAAQAGRHGRAEGLLRLRHRRGHPGLVQRHLDHRRVQAPSS